MQSSGRPVKSVLFGLALGVSACHALGCTPPVEQDYHAPVPWSATVDSAYARALTVATVRVLRVDRTVPSSGGQEGWVEKANVEPKRLFKGRDKNIPKFFNVGFSGTTCDTHRGFAAGTEAIVFLSSLGELILTVHATETTRYAEALRLLERHRR